MRCSAYCILTITLAFACGCAPESAPDASYFPSSTLLYQPKVEHPLTVSEDLPLIELQSNSGTFRAQIDTASFINTMPLSVANRLKLPIRPSKLYRIDAAGNVQRPIGYAHCDRLSIGGMTMNDVDFVVYDPEQMGLRTTEEPSISVMVFQEMLVTVDYPNRKLVLERGELPAADFKTVLSFQRAQTKMRIPVKVGSSDAWLCLATLYHGPLAIPSWAAKSFGATNAKEVTFKDRDGQPLKLKLAVLTEDIVIGEHRLSRPNAALANFDEPALGAPYLKEFSITFDLKNNLVRMTRASRSPLPPVPFFENKVPRQPTGPNVQAPVTDDQG